VKKMMNFVAIYARLTSHAYQSWHAIPLRLIVGFGFMEHGYAKIARGPEKYASILHALGVPAPDLLAWVTILVELFGGLAVFLGAFIPLASIPMAVVLLVAIAQRRVAPVRQSLAGTRERFLRSKAAQNESALWN
jgi:putative oxidoreductase